VCDAVEGLFLSGLDKVALRAAAEHAAERGIDVLFVSDGPEGDAIVLAAAIGEWVPDIMLGVRIGLGASQRHPAMLAREMTTFDRVSGGRAVLAFTGPFTEATAEAVTLCKEMWTDGVAVSEGPCYPVAGAINRPLPQRVGGPPVALDFTDGARGAPAGALLARCDLVLVTVGAVPPAWLPSGVEVCEIRGA
jgi:alkanesulfonate monooxygenase SsuD/methylene tetrahydromethanopterin reductase-like flavin-dependent oxidoreductase (luciferase family)